MLDLGIEFLVISEREKRPLTLMSAPSVGDALSTPPPVIADIHTIDYTCGQCGTVLLQADEAQVYRLFIRCGNCGSYNKTE